MAKKVYITKVRREMLRLMDELGPVSARGAVLKGWDYANAEKVLRLGAQVGVFQELPGSPSTFVPGPHAPQD